MYLSIKVVPHDHNVEVVQGFFNYTDVEILGVCDFEVFAHIPSRNVAASLAHLFGKLGIVTRVTLSADECVSDDHHDIINKLLGKSWTDAAKASGCGWARTYDESTMRAYRWDAATHQMWVDQADRGHWQKISKPYPERLMFMKWIPVQDGDDLPRGD